MRWTRGLLAIVALGLGSCSTTGPQGQIADDPASAPPTAVSTAAPPADTTAPGQRFALQTHCDVSTHATAFGGRHWVASTPLPELTQRHDASGLASTVHAVAGTMTALDGDHLRFVIADPAIVELGLTIDFVPTPSPPTSWCE